MVGRAGSRRSRLAVNEQIAEMVAAGGDRFTGLGMVPLQDVDLAIREAEILASQPATLGSLHRARGNQPRDAVSVVAEQPF